MNEAQRNVALFRYSLIREAADDALTIRQRGVLVRELTARTHTGPAGTGPHQPWDARSLDPAYRAGGFEALAPTSRTGEPATDKRLLDLAEALKREVPGDGSPGDPDHRHHRGDGALGAHGAAALRPPGAQHPPRRVGTAGLRPLRGRRAGRPRTGDALHGPVIAGRKTYLFCFIDDYRRALVGYRFGLSEDTVRLEAAFRAALAARGVPRPAISTTVPR